MLFLWLMFVGAKVRRIPHSHNPRLAAFCIPQSWYLTYSGCLQYHFHQNVTALIGMAIEGNLVETEFAVEVDGGGQTGIAFEEDAAHAVLTGVCDESAAKLQADVLSLSLGRDGHLRQFVAVFFRVVDEGTAANDSACFVNGEENLPSAGHDVINMGKGLQVGGLDAEIRLYPLAVQAYEVLTVTRLVMFYANGCSHIMYSTVSSVSR